MAIDGIYTIELYGYPDVKMRVKLGEDFYGLHFTSNSEEDCVSLSISDNSGKLVLCGIKVVSGINLIGGVNVDRLPKGSLFFVGRDPNDRVSAFGYGEGDFLLYTDEKYDDIGDLAEVVA